MIQPTEYHVIGIDIGGSHITAALLDLRSTNLLTETFNRKYVNSMASADVIFETWIAAVKNIYKRYNATVEKIGIAMPGPFEYDKGISLIQGQGKYDSLYGLNVKEQLADRLKIRVEDIKMMNDASCFLRGEVFGGAVRSYDHAIGLTLGTGLGSASYHNGITTDAELWNLPFESSIAEEYISTRWCVSRYQVLSGKDVANVKDLAQLSKFDTHALQVFEEFGVYLGAFLTTFVSREDPQVIVLGGNIAKAFNLFSKQTNQTLAENKIKIPLVQSSLGESAATIGAGSLWHTQLKQSAGECDSIL